MYIKRCDLIGQLFILSAVHAPPFISVVYGNRPVVFKKIYLSKIDPPVKDIV